jgi:adenylate kinase
LEENSDSCFCRMVIVGIPGVGKTTVISKAAESLSKTGSITQVIVFGSAMLDEAKKLGVNDRDEMRRLPVQKQRTLQELAATSIKAIQNSNVLIDTHLFINTKEGKYPGLPKNLLEILSPTHLVMITADPEDIFRRRRQDGTRNRDLISVEGIKTDLEISAIMIASTSVLIGAPFKFIYNSNDKIDEAVKDLVDIISGSSNMK